MLEKILEEIDAYIEEYHKPPYGLEVEGTVELLQECKDIIRKHMNDDKDNDGWISCKERLPEEYEDVEVTIEENTDGVGGKRYYTLRAWLQEEQWVIKKNPYHPTVIAWRHPTVPYRPEKGE